MTYQTYTFDINGNPVYARIDDDGVCRLTCCAEHPEFQAWLAEGNEPLPADEAP